MIRLIRLLLHLTIEVLDVLLTHFVTNTIFIFQGTTTTRAVSDHH